MAPELVLMLSLNSYYRTNFCALNSASQKKYDISESCTERASQYIGDMFPEDVKCLIDDIDDVDATMSRSEIIKILDEKLKDVEWNPSTSLSSEQTGLDICKLLNEYEDEFRCWLDFSPEKGLDIFAELLAVLDDNHIKFYNPEFLDSNNSDARKLILGRRDYQFLK